MTAVRKRPILTSSSISPLHEEEDAYVYMRKHCCQDASVVSTNVVHTLASH
jgi:hypothetical protein